MRERLTELLQRLGLMPEEDETKEVRGGDGPENPEIVFQSLSPTQADALGEDRALVCPVTRIVLPKESFYYLCRACNTAYSVEGWSFLRENDKGRCCNCRSAGTVVPVREERPFA